MRVYKILFWLSSLLTLSTLLIAIRLHTNNSVQYDFEINICLAIFGSAAVTVLSSLITYYFEKRKTLESFLYHTSELVKFLNKYQEKLSLERKIQFFLDYYDIDKHMWDADYNDISFMCEIKGKKKKYIYDNIYIPIVNFNNAVAKYIWNFRWYLDGSGKNDEVMKKYIKELEKYLIKNVEKEIPTAYDENNVPISFSKIKSVSPKLVNDIYKELYGRYFIIMHGKKRKNSMEDKSNE